MDRRTELQSALEQLLGTRNVYFNPKSTVKMSYPCFIFNVDKIETKRADNLRYLLNDKYAITYVTTSSTEALRMAHTFMETFDNVIHDRTYVQDNLYHYVYKVFY